MCEQITNKGDCSAGDACKYAHNHFEALYHHSKYKKRFCKSYPHNLQDCKYQLLCSYAHSEEEVSIMLLHNMVYDVDFYLYHYKTQFCPFSFVNHNRSLCVYAHNWQDLRRNPLDVVLKPVQCQLWKQVNFLVHYSEGCPNGSKCQYCHGWKEADFHLLNYKTAPCEDKRCRKGLSCPYFHSDSERRYIPKEYMEGFFVASKCNRNVTGVYKVPSFGRVDDSIPKLTSMEIGLEYEPKQPVPKPKGRIEPVEEIVSEDEDNEQSEAGARYDEYEEESGVGKGKEEEEYEAWKGRNSGGSGKSQVMWVRTKGGGQSEGGRNVREGGE